VPLGSLDPIEATPLGCAGISAYAAVKRVAPHLVGASTLVVIGIGGLGGSAVQIGRAVTGATIVAVDVDEGALARARELGADHCLAPDGTAAPTILELCGGAEAVLDFVGSDETLALAADVVARRGVIALLGLAGGTVPFGFFRMPPEASLTTVVAGTVRDLQEVVALARAGRIHSSVQTYPLRAVNEALDDLRQGRVTGRAVIVPDQGGTA
jgi:propanol-preferring alcohol dehydrogenase